MSTVQGDDRLEAEGSAGAGSEESSNADTGTAESSNADAGNAESSSAEAVSAKPAAARTRAGSRSAGAKAGRKPRAAPKKAKTEESAEPIEAATNGAAPQRPRLLEMYRSDIVPAMMREFEYSNVMQVPRLRKVVINIGLGEALTNPKAMESATNDLTTIAGQKPIVTRAKKSIAGFKLREGNPIGVCVTLRGTRMYHFIDRLLNAALPRIRDFRGVSPKSFDGRGNYSLGIREQIIFSEIEYGHVERIRGFQVTIATTARTDAEATQLLTLLGMPFTSEN